MEWVFVAILLLLSFVCMVGNIFAIFVILKEKLFKRRIWIYLLSLSCSDIYSLAITMPLTIAAFYDESILQIRSICILQGSTMNFLMGWSLFTIGTINIWKYKCIKSPLLDSIISKMWLSVYVGIVLLTSGFVAIAPIIGFSRYIHQTGRKWCVVQTRDKYRALLFVLVTAFIILCFIVVYCNIATYLYVRKEMRTYSQKYCVNKPLENVFNHRRYRVFQTTLKVTVMFLFCWVPLFTMILVEGFGGEVPLLFAKVSYICALAQGCVNPIVYYFKHHAFKKQVKRVGRSWTQKKYKIRHSSANKTDEQETHESSLNWQVSPLY